MKFSVFFISLVLFLYRKIAHIVVLALTGSEFLAYSAEFCVMELNAKIIKYITKNQDAYLKDIRKTIDKIKEKLNK